MQKLKQASKSLEGSHSRAMEESTADFISDLPDALLLNIFSFLDETAIIQSSVLSRRWRYLWTLVPYPEHIRQKRSSFKQLKIHIREEKLRLEEYARNSVSGVYIDVVKSIRQYFVYSLLVSMLPDFLMFGVVHLVISIVYMEYIHDSFWYTYSTLKSSSEEYLKRLQAHDSSITSAVTSYSTSKPMMELLFPDNYHPSYAKTAKLYGSFGMLLVMIISCSIAVLRWKVEFIIEPGEPKRVFHGFS